MPREVYSSNHPDDGRIGGFAMGLGYVAVHDHRQQRPDAQSSSLSTAEVRTLAPAALPALVRTTSS
jgi:hypothetical protein